MNNSSFGKVEEIEKLKLLFLCSTCQSSKKVTTMDIQQQHKEMGEVHHLLLVNPTGN